MNTVRVAIVGAGPAGCFTAQFIKKAQRDIEVCLIDQLPVPYGLVRYGVAPDHVGTKQVVHQFERQIEAGPIHFFGNVTVGSDVTVDELAHCFDVLIVATGLSGDRALGVSGESLPGIWGAGQITRLFNDHPSSAGFAPNFGSDVVVVGNGNVAVDIVRLLAKGADDFVDSEVSDKVQGLLEASGVRTIHMVGRSPITQAKFDAVMIRELMKLKHIHFQLADPTLFASLQAQEAECSKSKVLIELLQSTNTDPSSPTVIFHFGWVPSEFQGSMAVEQVLLVPTQRQTDAKSTWVKASSVIKAIGFEKNASAANDALAQAHVHPSLTVLEVGWHARGPRGKIADNRSDAKQLAEQVVALAQGGSHTASRAGAEGLRQQLSAKAVQFTDFTGWKKIDAKEQQQASEHRVRAKINTIQEMLETANN